MGPVCPNEQWRRPVLTAWILQVAEGARLFVRPGTRVSWRVRETMLPLKVIEHKYRCCEDR